ncbi:MAG: hypothetical protein ABIE14_01090 [Patescibacteria group bacterium]
MQNKNWQARFFNSLSLTGREERMVFEVEKKDGSTETLQVADEGARENSHTREERKEIGDTFGGIPIREITLLIPALRGNFVLIKKAEAALHEVRAATEQDICTGGVQELSKKAANEEIDCNKYTGLVNQLLREGAAKLGDVPGKIDCSNGANHHITVYKFPEINMIGAEMG